MLLDHPPAAALTTNGGGGGETHAPPHTPHRTTPVRSSWPVSGSVPGSFSGLLLEPQEAFLLWLTFPLLEPLGWGRVGPRTSPEVLQMVTETTLEIAGMECSHCAQRLGQALEEQAVRVCL